MKAVLSVIGKDRIGIIYNVSHILAENKVNILDINQTILQEYFTMMMLVDLSTMSCHFNELKKKLDLLGNQLGLSINIQHEDIFNSMHKI